MNFEQARKDLNARYSYKKDPVDRWNILKGDLAIEGDCADNVLTLIWLVCGRRMLRFWMSLITFKFVIWHCLSPKGVRHAVVWCRGYGWTDNSGRLMTRADLKAFGYKLKWPYLPPIVALKFLLLPLFKRGV